MLKMKANGMEITNLFEEYEKIQIEDSSDEYSSADNSLLGDEAPDHDHVAPEASVPNGAPFMEDVQPKHAKKPKSIYPPINDYSKIDPGVVEMQEIIKSMLKYEPEERRPLDAMLWSICNIYKKLGTVLLLTFQIRKAIIKYTCVELVHKIITCFILPTFRLVDFSQLLRQR